VVNLTQISAWSSAIFAKLAAFCAQRSFGFGGKIIQIRPNSDLVDQAVELGRFDRHAPAVKFVTATHEVCNQRGG
jgi:hypothetical protein